MCMKRIHLLDQFDLVNKSFRTRFWTGSYDSLIRSNSKEWFVHKLDISKCLSCFSVIKSLKFSQNAMRCLEKTWNKKQWFPNKNFDKLPKELKLCKTDKTSFKTSLNNHESKKKQKKKTRFLQSWKSWTYEISQISRSRKVMAINKMLKLGHLAWTFL